MPQMPPHFPPPIELPKEIEAKRRERTRLMIFACVYGIGVRLLIILGELLGGILFDSSALLMDAASTLFDVAFSGVLIACVKLAERPPDRNHPFGHGRFEPIAGLQLAQLLMLFGLVLAVKQVQALFWPTSTLHPINLAAAGIAFGAVCLLEMCYHKLRHTAKKVNSPALQADALHYRLDALTSLVATAVLLLGNLLPAASHFLDHLGAACIALIMLGLGFFAAKTNFDQLTDKVPEPHYFQSVRLSAKAVPGVQDVEKIRIQHFGPDAHVAIDVEVDPHMDVEAAHTIAQQVRASIQKDWPAVRDVTVHIEPYYPDDH